MADIELISFPFDSMKVLNEESGKMEGDRKYDAKTFRKLFKMFLSNGVYYGSYNNYGENGLRATLDGGLNIKILKGMGMIEGADYELPSDTVITLERPAVGNRVDRIVVRIDDTLATRKTFISAKQGNGTTPAVLQRDDNIYELCIAEVTVKSTNNLTEADIKDTRLDKNLCGIVNSLITIDGEEIYKRFQEYVDSVVDNLVRKDQDSVIQGEITANQFIGNLKGDVEGNAKTATNANYATSAGTSSSCSGNATTATSASKCTRKQRNSHYSKCMYTETAQQQTN